MSSTTKIICSIHACAVPKITQCNCISVCWGRFEVFIWYSSFSLTNKTDRHDITEILLKGALTIITLTLTYKTDHHNINEILLNVVLTQTLKIFSSISSCTWLTCLIKKIIFHKEPNHVLSRTRQWQPPILIIPCISAIFYHV